MSIPVCHHLVGLQERVGALFRYGDASGIIQIRKEKMSDILEARGRVAPAASPSEPEHEGARHGTSATRQPWRWRRPTRRRNLTPDRSVRSDCQCRHPYGDIVEVDREVLLDVRSLPLEGQVGRTLRQIELLRSGDKLRLVSSLLPWPLFAMLETRGYRYRLVGREAGNIQILIWSLNSPWQKSHAVP